MTTFIRCALWQIPTFVVHPDDISDLDALNAFHRDCASVENRCGVLEEVAKFSSKVFRGMRPPAGAAVIDLFVAPEYLFAKSGRAHFFDRAEKDLILRNLKQLSLDLPEVILVPGTVAWKKPASRGNDTTYFNCFRKNRLERAKKRIEAAGERKLIDAKAQLQKLDAAKTRLRERGDAIYLAENTAFVMHGGKVILKYHKRRDGGEVNQPDLDESNVIWVPGPRDSLFTVDGVTFGLEICAEKDTLQTLGQQVDVLVLIAASRKAHNAQQSIKEGGYIVHADAYEEPSAIHRAAGKKYFDASGHIEPGKGFEKITPLLKDRRSPLDDQAIERQVNSYAAAQKKQPTEQMLQGARTKLGGRLYFFELTLN